MKKLDLPEIKNLIAEMDEVFEMLYMQQKLINAQNCGLGELQQRLNQLEVKLKVHRDHIIQCID